MTLEFDFGAVAADHGMIAENGCWVSPTRLFGVKRGRRGLLRAFSGDTVSHTGAGPHAAALILAAVWPDAEEAEDLAKQGRGDEAKAKAAQVVLVWGALAASITVGPMMAVRANPKFSETGGFRRTGGQEARS